MAWAHDALATSNTATVVTKVELAHTCTGSQGYICRENGNKVSVVTRNTSTGKLTALSPASIITQEGSYRGGLSPDNKHLLHLHLRNARTRLPVHAERQRKSNPNLPACHRSAVAA